MAESVEPDDNFDWEKKKERKPHSLSFSRGFEYKEIPLFLLKNHNIEMSLSTLKRRIESCPGWERPDYNIHEVRASI